MKPASSFAQIDETAPAFERYEQVAAELTSGQEKLTTSRAQLDTLRSAYDADPTEANATAYNRSLAQFQADLEAYNDLVDQYTYFNSLEGIQERVDELTPLVEAAEKERNEARTVMTGIQRYGTEDQRAEWSAKLEAAEADYERYSKALNDLAAQYYYAENQAKRESLDASEDMKATDKATELARWADENYQEEQAAAIKEQLAFFSIIPAQAERYAALTEAGLDAESAYNLTEIFAGLEPEEGSDTVTSMQRYKAVVTSGLSDQEQLAALGTLMGESEYAKVETGYEFGVTPAMYVQARENVEEIDENGSTSQDEATRALSSIQGLTVREKAVLWQLQNKGWKATNNPFDTMTGQQVYNALHAGDEEETVELPRLGQTAGETDLPTISLPRLG